MRVHSSSAWPLILSLAIGCGSVSTLGGQGGSSGQGTGGMGTGGTATGGSGTGGSGTGGSAAGGRGGASGGSTGRGGATGGDGGHAGGSGGHAGSSGGHAGGSGGHAGSTGRGGAGGANGGPCWNAGDCGSGATCAPPGTPLCGGACIGVQHPCTSDTECQGDAAVPSICAPVPCSCPSGTGCVPGCVTQADCPEGQTCGSNHHCSVTSCTTASNSCPVNFGCEIIDLAGDICVRKACTTDSECSSACVAGYCYSAPGTCRLPLP